MSVAEEEPPVSSPFPHPLPLAPSPPPPQHETEERSASASSSSESASISSGSTVTTETDAMISEGRLLISVNLENHSTGNVLFIVDITRNWDQRILRILPRPAQDLKFFTAKHYWSSAYFNMVFSSFDSVYFSSSQRTTVPSAALTVHCRSFRTWWLTFNTSSLTLHLYLTPGFLFYFRGYVTAVVSFCCFQSETLLETNVWIEIMATDKQTNDLTALVHCTAQFWGLWK